LVGTDVYDILTKGGNKKENDLKEVEVNINEQGQVQTFNNKYGTFYLYNIDYLPDGTINIDKALQTLRFHLNKLNK